MPITASYIVLAGGVAIAATLLRFGLRLMRVDRIEAKKSAARTGSSVDALLGRSRTQIDFMADARLKGGMIYNKRKKRLEMSSRLSDDSLDRVFK